MEVLCTAPWSPGEMAEAARPLAVSFRPIHPTMDRQLQWRRLVNPFKEPQWARAGDLAATAFCNSLNFDVQCEGHHAWDLTAFEATYADESGRFVTGRVSNAELFGWSNPGNYRLDYVYEDFEWSHCKDAGWDFGSVQYSQE